MVDWNPAIWLASYSSLKLNDHAVQIYDLKTIYNDLNRGQWCFIHLEMIWYTQENIRNTQLRFVFLSFPFVFKNISACLKLSRPRLVIVCCHNDTKFSIAWFQ